MRDGGRLAAAIEVLGEIERRHRPSHLALKAWGDSARYAGARDRAFVSGLVLDVLRRRNSLAWRIGDDTARATVLAAARFAWGWEIGRLSEATADGHGPGALTPAEVARLAADAGLTDAPPWVRGDYPQWLDAEMARAFGEDRAAEGEALAQRAPLDLRVNTLKTDVAGALRALRPFDPAVSPLLPTAIRIAAPAASERAAPVEVAPEFEMGWFEVQDLGSQIAAACAGDIAGAQVLDYCAGGGGKTLALAAAMGGRGRIYAYDADARRLTDTVRRGQRAGVSNLEVRSPIHRDALAGLEGRMDLVFVDAPCTGSGVWRRHPDTKWRLSPAQLSRRMSDQDQVLRSAAAFVKPGGRLIYVTCSLFVCEDEDRVNGFIGGQSAFVSIPAAGPADHFLTADGRLRLTPRTAGADGFFVAALRRTV